MDDREELKKQFLIKHNLINKDTEKLKQDASNRKYERIHLKNSSLILMDSPPLLEKTKEFYDISNYLLSLGFSAPKIIEHDLDNGFLLIEDFGNNLYAQLLAEGDQDHINENLLYSRAVDLLVKLHSSESFTTLSSYEDEILIKEALQLTEYYLPVLNGEPLEQTLVDEYIKIWKDLLPFTKTLPNVVVLRDFHAENLMWLTEREGIKKVGLLDFQDALIGSPAYDLVSLLEDLRREVSNDLAEAMINRYLAASPHIARKDFLASYNILGAMKNCKIVGFCARKAVKDKNNTYLRLLPRMWKYIENNLKHPLLIPLKNWMDKALYQNSNLIGSPNKGRVNAL